MLKAIHTDVKTEIIKLFSSVEMVKAIYSVEYGIDLFHFQILTSNSMYNRPLMMKLLDLEYDVEDKFPDTHLTFEYIPEVYESEDDVVNVAAKLIYKEK